MSIPLAERLRPSSLEEVVGQEHLVGARGLLSQVIASGRPLSLILWGPPGTGKTTLARLYAKAFRARWVELNAVFSGVRDIRKVVEDSKKEELLYPFTVLFVDEIHRFNKMQQDAFLPYVERGELILVGTTTENPSFALNNALLSRVRVLEVRSLDEEAMKRILQKYEKHYTPLPLTPEARQVLIDMSGGDGRYLINLVENVQQLARNEQILDVEELKPLLQRRSALFDRTGDQHYNLISALHKSIRGSDADAALYWLLRILKGGEDPRFVARRLIRVAVEDVGLADPQALIQANAAWDTFTRLGSPEGELALAQVTLYLALAPKSNALYTAYGRAEQKAEESSQLNPPPHSLNTPTDLMKEMGYGEGYVYDHDTPQGCAGLSYFPESMDRESFYHPVKRGFEREMQKRQEYFSQFRQQTLSKRESQS